MTSKERAIVFKNLKRGAPPDVNLKKYYKKGTGSPKPMKGMKSPKPMKGMKSTIARKAMKTTK